VKILEDLNISETVLIFLLFFITDAEKIIHSYVICGKWNIFEIIFLGCAMLEFVIIFNSLEKNFENLLKCVKTILYFRSETKWALEIGKTMKTVLNVVFRFSLAGQVFEYSSKGFSMYFKWLSIKRVLRLAKIHRTQFVFE